MRRRPVLRPADRPVRAQEALPDHARASTSSPPSPPRSPSPPWYSSLPVLHRSRDRRRVRGDQLGDRRADPGPVARQGRPDHQRQLLARRALAAPAVGAGAERPCFPRTSAGGCLRPRRRARNRRSCSSGGMCRRARGGCSSTAARRRPTRWSAKSRRKSRRRPGRSSGAGEQRITIHQRKRIGFREIAAYGVPAIPPAHGPRARAVRRPGVPLQRRVLHVGDCSANSSRSVTEPCRCTSCCSLLGTSSGRCRSGGCSTGGPQNDGLRTYVLSAAVTVVSAVPDRRRPPPGRSWPARLVFFFASAGASSAYLTVSEIFPMETRALSIAFFYAAGTAAGGITGPLLFGHLIASGSESRSPSASSSAPSS